MAKTKDEIKTFVQNLVQSLGAQIKSINLVDDDDTGMSTIEIESPDSRMLIGRDGESLQALNSLLHRYCEKDLAQDAAPMAITLDVNNFQKNHIDSLKTKAHMMAERAKFFKSSIELDPMNGYERRIIHTFLEKDKNLVTDSTGVGKDRHIVVKFVENKDEI